VICSGPFKASVDMLVLTGKVRCSK